MGLAMSAYGVLIHASVVTVEPPWSQHRAVTAVQTAVDQSGYNPLRWAIEKPRVYGNRGEAAQKKDVEALGNLAKALRGELVPLGAKVKLWEPHAWKGNVPKAVHHRRARKLLAPAELALLDQDFGDGVLDVWDAVALELFATGRCGRGGTRRR